MHIIGLSLVAFWRVVCVLNYKAFLKAFIFLINFSPSSYNSKSNFSSIKFLLLQKDNIETISNVDLMEMFRKLRKSLIVVPPDPSAILLEIETAALFN